jgi:hypothetical protein
VAAFRALDDLGLIIVPSTGTLPAGGPTRSGRPVRVRSRSISVHLAAPALGLDGALDLEVVP